MKKLKSVGQYFVALALAVVISFSAVTPAHAASAPVGSVVAQAAISGAVGVLTQKLFDFVDESLSSAERNEALSVIHNYWVDDSLCPFDDTYGCVQLKIDDLYSIAADLTMRGFPCEVVSYEYTNAGGVWSYVWVIKAVGWMYIPGTVEPEFGDHGFGGGDPAFSILGRYFTIDGQWLYARSETTSGILSNIYDTLTDGFYRMVNGFLLINERIKDLTGYLVGFDEDPDVPSIMSKLDALIDAVNNIALAGGGGGSVTIDNTPVVDALNKIYSRLISSKGVTVGNGVANIMNSIESVNNRLLSSTGVPVGNGVANIMNDIRSLLTYVDGLEGSLDLVGGSVDGVEGALVDVNSNLETISNRLISNNIPIANAVGTIKGHMETLPGYVDGLEGLLSNVVTAVDGIEINTDPLAVAINTNGASIQTSVEGVYGWMDDLQATMVEASVAELNTLLTTNAHLETISNRLISNNIPIANAVNTIKGHMETLPGYVDGVESLVTTTNAKLDTIAGRLISNEVPVASALNGLSGKVTTMLGHVDGVEDKLSAIENALSNMDTDVDIDIENNTDIDINNDNDSYNVFYVTDPDTGEETSIIDLSGDALTAFGKLLNFLYQIGFKDALDSAGDAIGDLTDFYTGEGEVAVDVWVS